MVITYNDRIKGIPKKEQYKTIRAIREKYLETQIRELMIFGGRVLSDYPSYIIMNNGDIYSTLNTKLKKLKPGKKYSGYLFVGLTSKDNERKYEMIHRLVAKAFIDKDTNRNYVNHKDGNKENNNYNNLEWCTSKENSYHLINVLKGHKRSKKLTNADIKDIFYLNGKYRDIGSRFNVSVQTVCNIKRKSMYKRELKEVGLL